MLINRPTLSSANKSSSFSCNKLTPGISLYVRKSITPFRFRAADASIFIIRACALVLTTKAR